MPPPEKRRSEWHWIAAHLIFPMDRPPIRNGVVAVQEGRIAFVGTVAEARDANLLSHAPDEDLGNHAILPGLFQLHTHLDLSALHVPPDAALPFPEWLSAVIAHRFRTPPADVRAAIEKGLANSLAAGVTYLADISGGGESYPLLANAPLESCVFREILGLNEERAKLGSENLARWRATRSMSDRVTLGVSPHAPYSVRQTLFAEAFAADMPVAIHIAESRAEVELIRHRRGAFLTFLKHFGVWDEGGLVESFETIGAMVARHTQPVLLVHGNYLERSIRLPGHVSIVYCPRTHHAFGNDAYELRRLLDGGNRVVLGTDSRASNPDIDPMREALWLRRNLTEVTDEEVLAMITRESAAAMGRADELGTITQGKWANATAVSLPDQEFGDPYDSLWRAVEADPTAPRPTLFRGAWRAT